MRRVVVWAGTFAAVAFAWAAAGCGDGGHARGGAADGGGGAPSTDPSASTAPDADAGPPVTPQAGAPGMCGRWTASAVDLPMVPAPSTSPQLSVRGDARGGFTVVSGKPGDPFVAVALTSSGAADGAPLTLTGGADGGFDLPRAAEATPGGWVVAWTASGHGALRRYDATGAMTSEVPIQQEGVSSFDVAADGTIGVDDGQSVGWVRPGASTEDVTFYSGGMLEGWLDGTLTFATSTPPSGYIAWPFTPFVGRVSPDGTVLDFPSPVFAYDDVLVPGGDGHSAAILAPADQGPYAQPEGPLVVTFVSTDHTPRPFTFDAEVRTYAAAPRPASGGAIVAWASNGLTAGGGAAVGFAEIAPTGARSAIVALGNQVVAPTEVAMARSGDGKSYLVIGSNASVRASFLVTCAD